MMPGLQRFLSLLTKSLRRPTVIPAIFVALLLIMPGAASAGECVYRITLLGDYTGRELRIAVDETVLTDGIRTLMPDGRMERLNYRPVRPQSTFRVEFDGDSILEQDVGVRDGCAVDLIFRDKTVELLQYRG